MYQFSNRRNASKQLFITYRQPTSFNQYQKKKRLKIETILPHEHSNAVLSIIRHFNGMAWKWLRHSKLNAEQLFPLPRLQITWTFRISHRTFDMLTLPLNYAQRSSIFGGSIPPKICHSKNCSASSLAELYAHAYFKIRSNRKRVLKYIRIRNGFCIVKTRTSIVSYVWAKSFHQICALMSAIWLLITSWSR